MSRPVRRTSRDRKRILRCPMCGSVRVDLTAGSIAGQVYHCHDCQYVGSLILEVEVDASGAPLPE
ncbi:MAG TPA: hypothetical protein VMC82_06140 [Thermoplasmata archaeon]|nr:hypothetical protein [Thermoplasmata archaeon]